MSLDTDMGYESQQGGLKEPEGSEDPVKRFVRLVRDEQDKNEALRVYNEEYSTEEQMRVRREALSWFKCAKLRC